MISTQSKLIGAVDEAVRRVAPIHGIGGAPGAWRIDFQDAATREQRAAAEAVAATFVGDAASELIAHAAAIRWARQTGGITAAGVPVRTDDRTRTEIALARADAALTEGWSTQWKLADGRFVTIDRAAVTAIGAAVSDHMRRCFAAEAHVVGQVKTGKIKDAATLERAFDDVAGLV